VRELARVLITGGAGFVGGHLCERLLDDGAEVFCVDNLSTSAPWGMAALHDRAGFEFIEHDITEPLSPSISAAGFDTVFHLASPASPIDYLRLPIETLQVGAQGTAVALDVAKQNHARLVLASTSEVYGDPLEHPQRESYWGNVNPIGPRSVYDEAKRYAEALVFAHHRQYGADIGVARIFNTYGPRMRSDDGRAVPTFCSQALRGAPITVSGTGLQTRSLCYVADTVSGLIALARSSECGPFNIGNPAELSVLQIAELIRDLALSDSPIENVAAVQDDPQRRCPDITATQKHLNWIPEVAYPQGLRDTVDWFRLQSDGADAVIPGGDRAHSRH
jgi:dTDP-glucose 4,6-dehydratase